MTTTAIGPPEAMAYALAKLQADSALVALATGGIYRAMAPQAAINNPPYILINFQGGSDVLGATGTRIMISGLFQIAIYGPDALFSTLMAGYRLIDADLQRTSGTAQTANILSFIREQPIVLSEVVSGSDQVWTRVGGLYRAEVA